MKKLLAFMLMFVFAVTLASCGEGEGGTPEEITINGASTVSVDGESTYTITTKPADASKNVTWDSSNKEVATISSTGVLKALKAGTTTITAVVPGTEIKAEKEVTVNEGGEQAPAKSITVAADKAKNEIATGETLRLTATVQPSNADQTVTWTSNKPNIAIVSESGEVTGVSAGNVVITATSVSTPTVSKKVAVTVTGGQEVYPDMEGFEISIAEAGHALGNQDPFLSTYLGTKEEKEARQKAWRAVEEMFNCKLVVKAYPDEAPWGPTRIKYINDQALVNDPDYVIYVTTTDWTSQLASGKSVVDVTDLYATYGSKSKMGEGFKRAGTYGNKLYAISNSDNGVEYGLFYNLKLIQELGMDKTPAEMFNEGNWTIYEFVNYCKSLQEKLAGRGDGYYACAGEISYYWAKMMTASNVAIADVRDMSLHLTGDVADEVIAGLRSIYAANAFDPEGGYDASSLSFKEGTAVFCPGDTWFVNGADRWNMTDFDYGFVPYPRSEYIAKEDTKTAAAGGSCWMIAANYDYANKQKDTRPNATYVPTTTDIYRVIMKYYELTDENLNADPSYDPVDQARSYAQMYCEEDAGVDAVLFFDQSKILFDPFIGGVTAFYANPGMGALIRRVVRENTDYQQEIDTVFNTLNETFQRIYGS